MTLLKPQIRRHNVNMATNRKPSVAIDSQKFVQLWMQKKNPTKVAEQLGLKRHSVLDKASRLRRRGVELPIYKDETDPNNIDELNKIIRRYRK